MPIQSELFVKCRCDVTLLSVAHLLTHVALEHVQSSVSTFCLFPQPRDASTSSRDGDEDDAPVTESGVCSYQLSHANVKVKHNALS